MTSVTKNCLGNEFCNKFGLNGTLCSKFATGGSLGKVFYFWSDIREKTKGQQLKGKIVSALLHTFPHFSTLFHTFPPLSLKIKPFLKIIKENTKKKTKPFCTLVVARLSSSANETFWKPLFWETSIKKNPDKNPAPPFNWDSFKNACP